MHAREHTLRIAWLSHAFAAALSATATRMQLQQRHHMHGSYTAADGRTFEFDASWSREPFGVAWSATIVVDTDVVARPCGLLPQAATDDQRAASEVTRAIHAVIDALAAAG